MAKALAEEMLSSTSNIDTSQSGLADNPLTGEVSPASSHVNRLASQSDFAPEVDSEFFESQAEKASQIGLDQIAEQIIETLKNSANDPSYRQKISELLASVEPEERAGIISDISRRGYMLPSLDFNAPVPEDLSSRVRHMHLGRYGGGNSQVDSYVRDLVQIADKENFQIHLLVDGETKPVLEKLTQDLVQISGLSENVARELIEDHVRVHRSLGAISADNYAEDGIVLTNGDGVAHPLQALIPEHPDFNGAIVEAVRYAALMDATGIQNPELRYQEGFHSFPYERYRRSDRSQGLIARDNLSEESLRMASALGIPAVRQTLYNEGGNTLPGTRPDGQGYVLIGRDSLLMSTLHLRQTKPQMFNGEALNLAIDKLRANGQLTEEHIAVASSRLSETEQFTPEMTSEQKRTRAIEFIASVAVTEDHLPAMFGVKPENFIVVSQPEYHLDMAIRPWRPGEVLLHDYSADIQLLSRASALVNPEDSRQIEVIRSMKENAEKMNEIFAPLNDLIQSQLEAAGLRVVRSPGVFQGASEDGIRYSLNFLNGVPATSHVDNQQYFVTNATQFTAIARAFEEHIQGLGVERVHFVGSQVIEGQTAAESMSRICHAGLDCLERHHDGKFVPLPQLRAKGIILDGAPEQYALRPADLDLLNKPHPKS